MDTDIPGVRVSQYALDKGTHFYAAKMPKQPIRASDISDEEIDNLSLEDYNELIQSLGLEITIEEFEEIKEELKRDKEIYAEMYNNAYSDTNDEIDFMNPTMSQEEIAKLIEGFTLVPETHSMEEIQAGLDELTAQIFKKKPKPPRSLLPEHQPDLNEEYTAVIQACER